MMKNLSFAVAALSVASSFAVDWKSSEWISTEAKVYQAGMHEVRR